MTRVIFFFTLLFFALFAPHTFAQFNHPRGTVEARVTKVLASNIYEVTYDNGKKGTVKLYCLETPGPEKAIGETTRAEIEGIINLNGNRVHITPMVGSPDSPYPITAKVWVMGKTLQEYLASKCMATVGEDCDLAEKTFLPFGYPSGCAQAQTGLWDKTLPK